ncbi:helix-turn-helix domain-containing protein [Dechloromonas sp. H13]|uniref:helix-turn-helix domain-containing protein n=1 Tax=Dechloromonas sp. H13 TaxID=2570193 RepID=UPI001290DC13|nr:helix-turn-helix domain-containing protein [Dechloromonas sp. H13]
MARTQDNLAFADRLKQALKRSPKRIETPSELALQFNLQHPGSQITNQAAQKWLAGDNKPSPDKIDTLANMLGVSVQWLRYGIPESRPAQRGSSSNRAATKQDAPTATELQLLNRYRLLSEHQQGLIAELIEQITLDREMWITPPKQ